MADPYGGQKPGCIDPNDPLGCLSGFFLGLFRLIGRLLA